MFRAFQGVLRDSKTRGHSPSKNQERTMIIMATVVKVDGRTKAARAAKAAVAAPAKHAARKATPAKQPGWVARKGNGALSTIMTWDHDTAGTHQYVNPDPGTPIRTLYVQKGTFTGDKAPKALDVTIAPRS